jgi:murein L,D-transpeptidase YcbB/YkuD
VLFSGNVDRIAFNPFWNVPPSIVTNEILPAMKKHRHYLKEHDMEITGKEDGLPVIRQKPGPRNELGTMKFLFPNSFNIYFHDSPHKDLFRLNQRAFSHGCIRLADPARLALYLLRNKPGWTKEKLDSILATKKEYIVRAPQPEPVLICYFTAWVGDGNILEFRKDIYEHDARVERILFSE